MNDYDVNYDDFDGVDYLEMWEQIPFWHPYVGEHPHISEGQQNVS
jgi:hypothetical protein